MRKYILTGIAACFYYSGLISLVRRWMHWRGKRLVILNYHQASGGDLERHLLYLRRYYHILPLEKALEELYNQPSLKSYEHDPRTLLAVTFDDGYEDNYSYALPLAQRLQVPLTLYVIPGYIECPKRFWWHEGKRLVAEARVQILEYAGQRFDLRKRKERKALIVFIDERVRFACSVSARERFLKRIRKKLKAPIQVESSKRAMFSLTWEQIEEMDKSGWISFGAHTMNHPVLASVSEQKEVSYEVQECRRVLEQRLGHEVRSFAYPIGQWQHIDTRALHAVQEAGYRWALTTTYGINTPQDYPLHLKRVESDVTQHWLIIAAEVAGLWGFFARLRWHPFIRQYLTNAPSAK